MAKNEGCCEIYAAVFHLVKKLFRKTRFIKLRKIAAKNGIPKEMISFGRGSGTASPISFFSLFTFSDSHSLYLFTIRTAVVS